MRYFLSVVDRGSFTEAAEENFISQSAVSQQIKLLEKELGVELLKREKRTFRITPAGEYFYRRAKELMQEIEAMTIETKRIDEDDELDLHIGVLNRYDGEELHRAIAEFSEIYPEVNITISYGGHEELYHLLKNKEVELLLSDQRRMFDDQYHNQILIKAPCFIEVSERSELSKYDHVTAKDLIGHACILISSREEREQEKNYFKDTLNFNDNFLFVRNSEEGRLMVVGNRGFMPVEEAGTISQVKHGIRRIPLYNGNKQMYRNYCIFWKNDKVNYYIEEFEDILIRLMKQQ